MKNFNQEYCPEYYLLNGLLCFAAVTIIFFLFDSADIFVSKSFYMVETGFYFQYSLFSILLRKVFILVYVLAIIVACIGTLYAVVYRKIIAELTCLKWIFVLLCLVIGPGLVSNLLFKNHWGRARPVQIEQFGGTKLFTPPLIITDQCQSRNCSFVSGEASTIYSLFFALGFAATGVYRRNLHTIGILIGSTAGIVRILQGSHFLSDVVYAGIFMWLTTVLLWWGIFGFWRPTRT